MAMPHSVVSAIPSQQEIHQTEPFCVEFTFSPGLLAECKNMHVLVDYRL